MKRRNLFSILIFYLLLPNFLWASITIDSVSVTTSTCTNNGVAVIHAKSNISTSLLYAIVFGPALSPLQNSNTFSSLYPGSYTARVYDVNFDSLDVQFQITGNYMLPDFSLRGIDPTCPGFTDGEIVVLLDSARGLAPFTYSIVAPIAVPSQASPVFQNLTADTYFVRVTDVCGNYQTRTISLFNRGTGLAMNFQIIPSVVKIGCDTMEVTTNIYLLKDKWLNPITVTYTSTAGVITKQALVQVVDTINSNPGYFVIRDTIVGLDYGDLLTVQFSDVCGEVVTSFLHQVAPFDFELLFSASTSNCNSFFSASAILKQYFNYPYHYTYPMIPLSFVLTDLTTGLIADSGSCDFKYCGISLKPQIAGSTFSLTITDGCGAVWQDIVVWPAAPNLLVNVYTNAGCMDSTAALTFECSGFKSTPLLTLLSGPSNAKSTKPYYAYNDTIIYPQSHFGLINPAVIYLKDFPPGSYSYKVEDSCGNVIYGTFVVEEYMVVSYDFSIRVKPSCLSNNTVYYCFNVGSGSAIVGTIKNLATNQIITIPVVNFFIDSVANLPTGDFAFEVYYMKSPAGGSYYDAGISSNGNDCWVLRDTIRILPYTNNSFLTTSTVFCNGTNYLSIQADSSRGVPPYRYAIISGPQLVPLQDSSFFQISSFGNYVISMEDACGNNYTQQISVTSDSIPPIVKNGYFCEGSVGSISMASSPYLENTWLTPNGNTIVGDSIFFQPFTAADTGVYLVSTVVTINGCTDTFNNSFYLSGKDSVLQNLAICPGDSVYVGSNLYQVPGQYRDTLVTINGCDSLVITTLTYRPLPIINTSRIICAGDSILVGSNYYFQPGVYTDTLTTTGNCKSVQITNLTVRQVLDSIQAVICSGDSFILGNRILTNPGVYTDTLASSFGCDSVVVLTLGVSPWIYDSVSVTICKGDSIAVGNNYYATEGVYIDTIAIAGGCKKVQWTDLTVNFSIDSLNYLICFGDSVTVGNRVYTLPGIYADTLEMISGCDSILVTTISYSPIPVDSVKLRICQGDSIVVGNNVYALSGVYTDTIPVSGNCKKLQITTLNVMGYMVANSQILCDGDTFNIAGNSYYTSGIYTDTLVSVLGCDSIVVTSLTFLSGGSSVVNETICFGDSIYFSGQYLSTSGVYYDTLFAAQCDSVIILQLTVLPYTPLNLVIDTTTIVQGSTIQLASTASPGWNYQWSGSASFTTPFASSTSAIPDSSTWIYLSVVTADGCRGKDSVYIQVIETEEIDSCRDASIYIPNAFTPNNDGLNDQYKIVSHSIEIKEYKIFNRWGELVFESSDLQEGWDGIYKNLKCPSGTYVCIVWFENCRSSKLEMRSGFITLLE